VIDRSSQLHIAGVPGVSVYPDDRIPGGFYSFPDCPRLAQDDQQQPQMKLTLYGEQASSKFQVAGGLVVITTSLGLCERERILLAAALQAKLGRENPGAALSWLQMIWVKGRCDLWLAKDIQLSAQPSLYDNNSCVFQASCNKAVARNLEQAWCNSLADIYVRYNMTAQASTVDFIFEGILNTVSYDVPSLITRVKLP
jgi:hypothetical protein